ncbi:S1C family serine protease [Leptothermofonsia sp. ETS-13]|uniref:S1C family serine protease n=1 Tax=Leptothermofonsia sp. ETS-13 TaxID=3035696 RepID=UPI003BA21385
MKLRYLLLCLASLTLILAAAGIKTATQVLTDRGGQKQAPALNSPTLQAGNRQPALVKSEQQIANEIFQTVNPAVVTIYCGAEIGSGSIITSEGLVITNKHVVWSSPVMTVKTAGGKTYKGWVTSVDMQYDLALVQLETKDRLPTVRLASKMNLKPGQKVYAIGSPGGQAGTFTKGTFTRITKHGSLQTSTGLLQPGNSGGPLLNSQGEMVGVNKGLLKDGSGLATSVIPMRMFIERTRRAAKSS